MALIPQYPLPIAITVAVLAATEEVVVFLIEVTTILVVIQVSFYITNNVLAFSSNDCLMNALL